MTKEERYLLKLYELANKSDQEINRYTVGQAMGQKEKGVDTIVRLLAQANFVKKGEEEDAIYLTENGLTLIAELQGKKS